MKRGEIWWADLGPYRLQEQTGRRPVIIWQSDTLSRVLQSVLVIPLTTNLDRGHLAGTAMIQPLDDAPPETSVALS
ncbi:MAG: type II toxin-antitoxin system PemK/MazF family toxin [Deltaproteobacteria bacterium]|nr:MAG: type II toxin-antitoxin system PemK/MazF family toxin [Deltaproteobacteria bacterium]TMQ21770.1 MAG: type II toxin-antitoxin system PemK/MazF family toxin [Deltaproteobacteria bacterium]